MYTLYDEYLYYAMLEYNKNKFPVKNYIMYPQYVRRLDDKILNIYI